MLKNFSRTITYKDKLLKIYINGLIDQVIETNNIIADDVELGGFNGRIENYKIYNRALNQEEIKSLTILKSDN